MTNDSLPEGASKRYRVQVPDGQGGFKDLAGYTVTGEWRTGPDATPTIVTGYLESDTRFGYVDLPPNLTAQGGVTRYLDLKAVQGSFVHVETVRVQVVNR
jgi:hypothetical protein